MRYEPVTTDVKDLLRTTIQTHFPELAGAGIMCVFDMKKKVSKGRFVLAYIKKANEVEKFLTLDDQDFEEGPDYFIFINKKAWEIADAADRERLIRHELRHTDVDLDHEKNPFKLRAHTVEDFYEEISLNADKPRWADDLGLRVKIAYESEGDASPAETDEESGEASLG
jgi:hypothetical protein